MKIIMIALAMMFTISVAAQTMKVDVAKSTVRWKGTKKIGEHVGTIKIKEGNIELKDGTIVGGELIIDMKGITISDTEDPEDRADIIKDISSKQFFNVKEYPTAKLVITGYFDGQLAGKLTIKGITNPIVFKTSYQVQKGRFIANTISFTIDRQKWKLKFSNWLKENVLDDPIHFKVHIEAV